MRTLLVVAVLGAACLLVGANVSSAADQGQVPASMLAQMGLGGMQPMSDLQGQAIRGMGRRGGSGGTIQANVVVQISHTGNAGQGGNGGNNTGGAGGSGGNVNGSTFDNHTAAFIQVNVNNLRLGGIF
jgi:hypothetical protein